MNESKQFHEWTNGNGEVLILRRIPPSRRTYNEFQWPTGVGTRVECPDWNPKPICGGGLHGWPLGFGLGESSAFSIVDDVWLVLGAKPEDVVGELDGGAKCKCREGIIRYEGDFAGAVSFVSTEFANCVAAMAGGDGARSSANGDYAKSSANGDYARSSAAGDCATVEAVGGDNLAAVVGLNGKVRVGERGAFAIAYQDRCGELRFLTGKAGENGIAANVWYHVVDGALVEVTQCG